MVPCLLVLSSTVAAAETPPAEEVALTPVCAEVDASRDTLGESERALARAQLARVLQDADLLVVEHDCVEHYVLSHEQRDGDFVVRLSGPGGVRRVRNPERARLADAYDRMLTALLDAQDEAAEAAANAAAAIEPTDSTYVDATASTPVVDAVAPDPDRPVRQDSILYGQLSAGNYGTGAGAGFRVPTSRDGALDFGFTTMGDGQRFAASIGMKYLQFMRPEAATSPYLGGGVSYAGLSSAMTEDSGARLDGMFGVMLNRTAATRFFIQADLGLPLFSVAGAYEPTFMASVGVGQ